MVLDYVEHPPRVMNRAKRPNRTRNGSRTKNTSSRNRAQGRNSNSNKTFSCPNNCGRTYHCLSSFRSHVRYECGKEPSFTCQYCQKKFYQPDYNNWSLESSHHHRDDDEKNTSLFHCPNNCGRVYKYKSGMLSHLKMQCGQEPQFSCRFCHKRFFYRNWLCEKKNTRTSESAFVCPKQCGRKYAHKRSLDFHIKYECGSNQQVRVFDSNFGNRKLVTKSRTADARILPTPFHCPNNCGRSYAHKASLSFHLRCECGVEPQFECDICFGRRRSLTSFQTNAFSCPNNCGKTYKHKGSVTFHVKYECGKEPQFVCMICERKFTQPGSLKSHLGVVHKVISK
ncbi:zinc finger protein OZF-like [Planococcus citri]|uniref:zinc finger protein OZF-like n=1 Tax=Planococcus citri TaxID=170843 RepID=UPI0031F7EBB9